MYNETQRENEGEGRYALTGGLIFDGENFFSGHALVVKGGAIEALVPEAELDATCRCVELNGELIAPGFVDLQLNGAAGVMLNDSFTSANLEAIHAVNLQSGCTSFLPTLITASDEDMLAAMETVARYRAEHGAASVAGLHLEGPYINPVRKGIHNEAYIRRMSPDMREKLAEFASRIPLYITLAPECVDAEDIHTLASAGAVLSAGHSAANYEEAKRGFRAGIKSATHLFNGMSQWQSREPGLVGAVFDSPGVSCGMIADGHHVHYTSLALAKRLKGPQCFLVTDATAPVGTDMTEFLFCGQKVYVRNGMCVNESGTLGGSLLTMIGAVRNSVLHVGVAPAEALRMASLHPATLMGQDWLFGVIAPGRWANLAIFSPVTFALKATIDRGNLHVWRQAESCPPCTENE